MSSEEAPLSPRRRRRREARTNEILDAAMGIVEREGLEGLTVQRLARELDYAVGAMYRYFPSKAAVISRLERTVLEGLHDALRERWGRLDAMCEERRIDGEVSALAALVVGARVYLGLAVTAPAHHRLLSLTLSDPRLLVGEDEAPAVTAAARPLIFAAAERFAAAEETGALDPGNAPARALVFWSALQGLGQLRKLSHFEPLIDTDALAPVLVDALLKGWGARPPPLAEAETVATEVLQHKPPP